MDALIKSIKHHEGVRLLPYLDTAGKITIGWGRCLSTKGISMKEANILLASDIADVVDNFWNLPFDVVLNCNPTRRRILVEMLYNLGLGGVMKFKKMMAAIEQKDFDLAADEMLSSLWAKQVGIRAQLMAQTMREG